MNRKIKKFLFSALFIFVLMAIPGLGYAKEDNPLLKPFPAPFETPPFDLIKVSHFEEAIKAGIAEHQKEIKLIIEDSREPDFSNTIGAFDRSGKLLERVTAVYGALQGACTSPELQQIARSISPLLSAHYSDLQLNAGLFARIKKVYEKRLTLKLSAEQMFLLENLYKDMVRNGALLDEEQKNRLRQINQELSLLSLQFGNNLLAETNQYKIVLESEDDLQGLPPDVVALGDAAARQNGLEGKYVFTVQVPSIVPFLTYSSRRDLREKLFRFYSLRGNNNDQNDNKEIIKKILQLRQERAEILGYKTFAHFVIEKNMAKTPENALSFLSKLWQFALKRAKNELAEMQQIAAKDGVQIAPWDWWYYAEKLRQQKYNLSDEELRPYFSLENVKQGIFTLCNKLYGLEFKKLSNVSVYHPEVEVYQVLEKNNQLVGLLYLDFFPRSNKRSGAWSGALRRQYYESKKRIFPISTIVCNFTRPTAEKPALLSLDEVETFFHEFGHSLATLLSDSPYRSRSVPRDGVELPSQIMENWAFQPELLRLYARHYKTGEVIPDQLIKKINNSSLFNQGFAASEYLAAALLDLKWHTTLFEKYDFDVNSVERQFLEEIGLIAEIIPRYRSTYFQHIFSGGYAAGYYVYIWAEVLDSDAFSAFKEQGLFNRKVALSFRKNILEKYGALDLYDQYIKFRGREPNEQALLKKRGFSE